MEIAKYLVENIGPRWSGRKGTAEAAEYLSRSFSDLKLEVERQDFPFLGWEVDREPQLQILEPEPKEAALALMEYSGSTPEAGIEGELQNAGLSKIVAGFLEWPQYAVITDDGTVGAYLVVHVGLGGWSAPPIPLMNPEPFYPIPMAILSEADHHCFQKWIAGGKRIRVRFQAQGHVDSSFWGHNVIATLPGSLKKTIVFCAHLDTAFNTPGANNNAGGVQALYDLAERLLSNKRRRLTYQFLACDACEWDYLGSRYFLKEAEREGRFDCILAGINIDTVASGDSFYFLAWPDSMRKRAEKVVDRLNLQGVFKRLEYLGRLAGSDHYSFIKSGIPASEILFWPCSVYKLPEDDMSQIDENLIKRSTEIAFALSQTFEEECI